MNSDQQCHVCPQAGPQPFRCAGASLSHRHHHLETSQLPQPQEHPDTQVLTLQIHPHSQTTDTSPSTTAELLRSQSPPCIYSLSFQTALSLDEPVPPQPPAPQPRITTAHRRAHQTGISSSRC